jgi:hypothetical protein
MESEMFGVEIKRALKVETVPALTVRIIDSAPDCEVPVFTNFFFPRKVPIKVNGGHFNLVFDKFSFSLETNNSPFVFSSGCSEDNSSIGAIVSNSYGEVEEAMSISMLSNSKEIKVVANG